MSGNRSGYEDDGSNPWLYMQAAENAINGKRGQAFLKGLALAMDEMPVKVLCKETLVSPDGMVCALGVALRSRGIDIVSIDSHNPGDVGRAVGIAPAMAAEIAHQNDEGWNPFIYPYRGKETPEDCWLRMRKWVNDHIQKQE